MKRLALVFLFIFSFSKPASATLSFFYAVGPLFQSPGSVRVGFNDWEAGLLSGSGIGFDKIFAISNVSYMAFGPVLTFGDSLGLYGSIGRKDKIFWILNYRVELQSIVGFNGYASGSGLFGLTVDF